MSASLSPSARFLIGGVPCASLTEIETEATSYRRAGTFRALIALHPADAGVQSLLAGAGTSGLPVSLTLAGSDAAGVATGASWSGIIDQSGYDVRSGLIEIEGRDDTARLVDLPVAAQFMNQTASDIIETLAAEAGLATSVAPTANLTGQFYQIDHSRSALGAYTRFASAWDLVSALADEAGCDAYVVSGTLFLVPSAQAYGTSRSIDVASLLAGGSPILTRLRFDKRPAIDAGIQVTGRSGNSRQKAVGAQSYSASAGADNAKIVFVVPNATDETALAKATALYRDIARHGAAMSGDMAAGLDLAPRDLFSVTGTAGAAWDGVYVVDLVTRRLSARHGFEQSFVARAMTD